MWRDGPDNAPGGARGLLDRRTIRVTSAASAAQGRLDLQRHWDSANNAAMIRWEQGNFNHATNTVVSFNGYYTRTMPLAEKQGRACNVIGNVLGLEDKPASSDRDDCLESPQTWDTPTAASYDLVEDFYGPTLEPLSGSLVANKMSLQQHSLYSLTANASGHALSRIEVFLDSGPTPIASSGPLTCVQKCTPSFTATFNPADWSAGAHTLDVVATNGFYATTGNADDTVTRTLAVTVTAGDIDANVRLRGPLQAQGKYFGYNDPFTPITASLTQAGGPVGANPPGGAANLVRSPYGAWRDLEPTSAAQQWAEPHVTNLTNFYNGADARGMTPIIQLYAAPQWASQYGAGTECGGAAVCAPSRAALTAWRGFAAEMARRFPKAIFEVWNEPNFFPTYWRRPGGVTTAAEVTAQAQIYAEFAVAAAEAIRTPSAENPSPNPNHVVLGGAFTTPLSDNLPNHAEPDGYLRDVLAWRSALASTTNAGRLDGISLHLYPAAQRGASQTDMAQMYNEAAGAANPYTQEVLKRLRAVLNDPTIGADHLGFWVTEFGFSNADVPGFPGSAFNEDVEQPRALAAGVRKLLTTGDVRAVVIHKLADRTDAGAHENEIGVYEGNSFTDAKKAFCWLEYMASVPVAQLPAQCEAPPLTETYLTREGDSVRVATNGAPFVECQLDAGPWFSCVTPNPLPASVLEGHSTLRARAYRESGVQDESPRCMLLATFTPCT